MLCGDEQKVVQDPNSDSAKLDLLKDEISTLRGEVRGLSTEFTEAEQILLSKEAEAKDDQVQLTGTLVLVAQAIGADLICNAICYRKHVDSLLRQGAAPPVLQ